MSWALSRRKKKKTKPKTLTMPCPQHREVEKTQTEPCLVSATQSHLQSQNILSSVLRCKKSEKEGKTLAWLSQDLLVKLNGKKEVHM